MIVCDESEEHTQHILSYSCSVLCFIRRRTDVEQWSLINVKISSTLIGQVLWCAIRLYFVCYPPYPGQACCLPCGLKVRFRFQVLERRGLHYCWPCDEVIDNDDVWTLDLRIQKKLGHRPKLMSLGQLHYCTVCTSSRCRTCTTYANLTNTVYFEVWRNRSLQIPGRSKLY